MSALSRGSALSTETDDLRQLRDALRGVLGTTRADITPSDGGDWRTGWPVLAEVGVTGLCVSERRGGYGFAVEAAVTVAQEFGAALHGSPYPGVTASAHVLGRADLETAVGLVEDLLAGERICALGILDPSSHVSDAGEVTGVARLVDGAAEADAVVLVTPSSRDALLATERTRWSVDPAAYRFDVTRSCGVMRFDGAPVHRCAGAAEALRLYGLLLAADALGGLQRMLDRTVTYARERDTFGRPIGGFQAVQHRLVDHTIRVRGMALVLREAARMLGTSHPSAAREVALAQLVVNSHATHVLHDLVQLTGAIGFTWDHGIHLYERRAHHDARLAHGPRSAVRSLACGEGWAGG